MQHRPCQGKGLDLQVFEMDTEDEVDFGDQVFRQFINIVIKYEILFTEKWCTRKLCAQTLKIYPHLLYLYLTRVTR